MVWTRGRRASGFSDNSLRQWIETVIRVNDILFKSPELFSNIFQRKLVILLRSQFSLHFDHNSFFLWTPSSVQASRCIPPRIKDCPFTIPVRTLWEAWRSFLYGIVFIKEERCQKRWVVYCFQIRLLSLTATGNPEGALQRIKRFVGLSKNVFAEILMSEAWKWTRETRMS
jgi:hypothetical protein